MPRHLFSIKPLDFRLFFQILNGILVVTSVFYIHRGFFTDASKTSQFIFCYAAAGFTALELVTSFINATNELVSILLGVLHAVISIWMGRFLIEMGTFWQYAFLLGFGSFLPVLFDLGPILHKISVSRRRFY